MLKTGINQRQNHRFDLGQMGYFASVLVGKEIVDCKVLDFSMGGIGLEIPKTISIPAEGSLLFRDVAYDYQITYESSGSETKRLGLRLTEVKMEMKVETIHRSGIKYDRNNSSRSFGFLEVCACALACGLFVALLNEVYYSNGVFSSTTTATREAPKSKSASSSFSSLTGNSRTSEPSQTRSSIPAAAPKQPNAVVKAIRDYFKPGKSVFSDTIDYAMSGTSGRETAKTNTASTFNRFVQSISFGARTENKKFLEQTLSALKKIRNDEVNLRGSKEVGQPLIDELSDLFNSTADKSETSAGN